MSAETMTARELIDREDATSTIEMRLEVYAAAEKAWSDAWDRAGRRGATKAEQKDRAHKAAVKVYRRAGFVLNVHTGRWVQP